MRRRSRLAALALLAFACSDGRRGDEITAVPFPSTIELAAADLSSLQPDPGDGTLVFTDAPAILDDVRPGNILVAGVSDASPAGLLRAVISAERVGSQLTLETALAPIQLAYKKVHVHVGRSAAIAAPGVASRARAGEGFDVTQPFDYVLFDGDGDPATVDDQIVTSGQIGGGFEYELEMDFDWGSIDALPDVLLDCLTNLADLLTEGSFDCSLEELLPEAKVTFDVFPEVRGAVGVHGAAIRRYEKEIDLAHQDLQPIVLGPLVFLPTIDLIAKLEGGASAQFRAGIEGSATFHTSVALSSRSPGTPQFRPPELVDTDFAVTDAEITLHADAKVGVGGRLNLMLFGVTGPYAEARAYAEIAADLLATPCWSLHTGLDSQLGVKITVDLPLVPRLSDEPLVDWESPVLNPLDLELTTGTCAPPPESSTLPPGSGPDADHYARPTFEPWARAFSSPVEGVHAGSPGNSTLFSDLLHTIDGHFVRSGFGVLSLIKFSEADTWCGRRTTRSRTAGA